MKFEFYLDAWQWACKNSVRRTIKKTGFKEWTV